MKAGRKRRFACTYMNVQPALLVNRKLENNVHRGLCDVTLAPIAKACKM